MEYNMSANNSNRFDNCQKTNLISWNKLEEVIQKLYLEIIEDQFFPEVIFVLTRGGMIPGVMLSSLFKVKQLFSIWVEKTNSNRKVKYFSSPLIKKKRILLVEDFLETGKSLEGAVDYLSKKGGNIRTLALFKSKCSIIVPDYFYSEIENISFPWEST